MTATISSPYRTKASSRVASVWSTRAAFAASGADVSSAGNGTCTLPGTRPWKSLVITGSWLTRVTLSANTVRPWNAWSKYTNRVALGIRPRSRRRSWCRLMRYFIMFSTASAPEFTV